MGRPNRYFLQWWASSLASKNFGDSQLWTRIQQYLQDGKLLKGRPSFFKLPRAALYCLRRTFFKAPVRLLRLAAQRSRLLKAEYIFVTHLDKRSFDASGRYQDLFWQPLLEYMDTHKMRYAIIGLTTGDTRLVWKKLLSCNASGQLVLPLEVFMNPIDMVAACCRCMTGQLEIPDEVSFCNRDIAKILLQQYEEERYNGYLMRNMLNYDAFLRIFQKTRARRFFWPWENHSWEKMLMLAKEASKSDIRLIGYQHATVPPWLVNHFPGPGEPDYAPFPDRIITTGRESRDILEHFGHFPKDCLKPGCALRYCHLFEKTTEQKTLTDHLSVIGLALTFDAVASMSLLEMALDAFADARQTVKIRCHPLLSPEQLISGMNKPLAAHFSFSKEPRIQDFLNSVDCLVYTKTGVAFEAAYCGVPLIRMGGETADADDSLFNHDALKWTAEDADQLRTCVLEIASLDAETMQTRWQATKTYIENYLQPVTEEGLRVFLEA